MPEFKTIRQTAATGITSEHHLRLLVAQGVSANDKMKENAEEKM